MKKNIFFSIFFMLLSMFYVKAQELQLTFQDLERLFPAVPLHTESMLPTTAELQLQM